MTNYASVFGRAGTIAARVLPALSLGVVMAACGSQSSLAPSGGDKTGTISGTVVKYGSAAPVQGATVLFAGVGAITDAQGRFLLTGVPAAGDAVVTVSAPGHLLRGAALGLAGGVSSVTIDTIAETPPFSLEFYRQFVRDGFEQFSLRTTAKWTRAPSFYFKTTVETSGIVVPDATIDRIQEVFTRSVPELSGGRFQVAAFERGPDARPPAEGWVNVTFHDQLGVSFGTSSVGGNTGTIAIRFGMVSTSTTNPYNCATPEVGVADHEITHTMGYWHTANVLADTFSGEGCPGTRPDYVRYHAALMYSRPVGNRDPDIDAAGSSTLASTAAGRSRLVVACVWR